ncbi:MAG: glutamate decarboxylase [Christensenellaceae bacterium]
MLHYNQPFEKEKFATPKLAIFGADEGLPRNRLNKKSIPADTAYNIIKDELLDEGNARQNLATFCGTYMEPEATKLMAETLAVNAIDKSEYPRCTEMENYCVNILGDLWNAKEGEALGTSTVGSSEACMLGGLAMKFRWRDQAEKLGIDIVGKTPNLVISSGYQICWEKFCMYWDIEMRLVPLDEQHMSMNMDSVMSLVDENTIGIVGILGITYTGKFDDIKRLDHLVEEYNKEHDMKVYIHVDGASGGMVAPFIDPKLEWDFRLKNVMSINTSGHKYGLVYPGIGWVLWRNEACLPKRLIFYVNYLGGEQPTMAINFSRSASQIMGQYYMFLRLGLDGWRLVQSHTRDVARHITQAVVKAGIFEIYNDAENVPIICYKLKNPQNHKWTLYELADRLAMKGWQVPAYTLPANMTDVLIQRFVIRADMSYNMADDLIQDMNMAIEYLEKNTTADTAGKAKIGSQGFTH